jgi:uncharacterized RDD family membrane protein YckC
MNEIESHKIDHAVDLPVIAEFENGTYHYAGFWLRFVAHLIDFTLLNGIELLLESILSKLFDITAFNQQVFGMLFSLGFYYWYFCVYQVKTGTTLGKKLLGIYVIDEKSGRLMSTRQAIYRMSSYLLSYLIIGCGFLMAAFHPQKKGLHDLLAGTVSVVRNRIKNSG